MLVLAPFFKRGNFFSFELLLHTQQKSVEGICVCLFVGYLFCSIGLYVYPPPIPYRLNYYSCLSFEMGQTDSSYFILLFKYILAILVPFPFHINFKISFDLATKKSCQNLTEFVLDLHIILGEFIMLGFPIHEHSMSLNLLKTDFFHQHCIFFSIQVVLDLYLSTKSFLSNCKRYI